MLNRLIKILRNITPLSLRIKFGPYLAYIAYLFRVYVFKNGVYKIKVLSLDETLDKVKNENLSVIRFGDGEMSLIDKIDLGFQKSDVVLSAMLKEILTSDKPGLLLCIPGIFGKLNNFANHSFWFTVHHVFKHGDRWLQLLPKNYTFGDAFITRPYLTYDDATRKESGKIFDKMISLWKDKEVVLIEGQKSRLGVGNNLFSQTKSLARILCPAENAFEKYEEIKGEALKIDKSKLILISLGPTAKVLAYELFLLGYRVIDIGHIDMEYEMYLRSSKKLEKVPFKYFNEINERAPDDCSDPEYLSQIISRIL